MSAEGNGDITSTKERIAMSLRIATYLLRENNATFVGTRNSTELQYCSLAGGGTLVSA